MPPTMRHAVVVLGAGLMAGCVALPVLLPLDESQNNAEMLNGKPRISASSSPLPLNPFANLVSNNSGSLVSNNVASLAGSVLVPGRLISNNSGSYRISALDEVPLQRALVYLSDTRERLFLDPDTGLVVSTATDEDGKFRFAKAPANDSVVVNAVLSGNRRMVGFLDTRPDANKVSLSISSTLVTEFLRSRALAMGGNLTLGSFDPDLEILPAITQLTQAALNEELLAIPDLNVGRIPDMNRAYLLGFSTRSRPLKQAWESLLQRDLRVVTTLAGSETGFGGDGGPATRARLQNLTRICRAQDGSLYLTDTGNGRIRRLAPDGVITTVAGGGTLEAIALRMAQGEPVDPIGNGGPATSAYLQDPSSVVALPGGGLLISEGMPSRIRLVRPDGTIQTLLGPWTSKVPTDGPLVANAGVNHPLAMTLGPDGAVYLADGLNFSVRKLVLPDLSDLASASITRVAGIYRSLAKPDTTNATYEGALAKDVRFFQLSGLCSDPSGNLYLADTYGNRVLRVGADERIQVVAGTGSGVLSGDGGPANQAGVPSPGSVVYDPKNNRLLVGSFLSPRIRAVDLASGVISTLVGTGTSTQDGLISEAALGAVPGLIVTPEGDVVFSDNQSARLRRLHLVDPP